MYFREAVDIIDTKEMQEGLHLRASEKVDRYNNEAMESLVELGYNPHNLNEGLVDDILKKIKTIKDELKLNKIYSFLFIDEFKKNIEKILADKGIKNKDDVTLVTAWITTAHATLQQKRDFLTQIVPGATDPIIDLTSKTIKEYTSVRSIKDLITNDHPVLETFVDDCITWVPNGASGAAPGPVEGFLKLLSPESTPPKKGDVQIGNLKIEVKANKTTDAGKTTNGGAMCGGKGAKQWTSIDVNSLIHKKFNTNIKITKPDSYRITSGNVENIMELAKNINSAEFNKTFMDIIKLLVSGYFTENNNARKKFYKTLNSIDINPDDSGKKVFNDKLKEPFTIFTFEYYMEVEGFNCIFIANQTKQNFIIFENGRQMLKNFDSLFFSYADFHWHTAPTSVRIGLK